MPKKIYAKVVRKRTKSSVKPNLKDAVDFADFGIGSAPCNFSILSKLNA